MRPQRTDAARSPITAIAARASSTEADDEPADGGFTLPELLVVVAIVGLLAAAATLAVSGMSTQASGTGCDADRRQLQIATEAYFAQTRVDMIPALGTDHDAVERTLVAAGFLTTASKHHDLDAAGIPTPGSDSPC